MQIHCIDGSWAAECTARGLPQTPETPTYKGHHTGKSASLPFKGYLKCPTASQRAALCDHSTSQATGQVALHPAAKLCSSRALRLLLSDQLSIQTSLRVSGLLMFPGPAQKTLA